jgi:hypothetical protein
MTLALTGIRIVCWHIVQMLVGADIVAHSLLNYSSNANCFRPMVLSSDELAILEYLRSWKGAPVSMVEICRCADSRKRFRETPHWAKGMMSRLVEANLVEVNDRGHYRCLTPEEKKPSPAAAKAVAKEGPKSQPARTVGEDYFPATDDSGVVGENYFPAATETGRERGETAFWVSPQIREILKKAGKKLGGQGA